MRRRSRGGLVRTKQSFAKNQLPLICKERGRLSGGWRKAEFPFRSDSNDDLIPAMRKPGKELPEDCWVASISFVQLVAIRARHQKSTWQKAEGFFWTRRFMSSISPDSWLEKCSRYLRRERVSLVINARGWGAAITRLRSRNL